MIGLLAQQSSGGTLGDTASTIANIFGSLDALAQPKELMDHLQQLPIVLAGVFIAIGLVCLLQGFRLYRMVVLIIALVVGLAVGYRLGQQVQAEIIVAVCLGVLLAVVAWPMMKYAVAAAGGIAGAFIGANMWVAFATEMNRNGHQLITEPWVGALVGLMALGLLSFILFELTVVLFTSLSGAVLATIGIMALLLQVPAFRDSIVQYISDKPVILPMLVAVPTVIGLVIQQQHGGMKAAAGKGEGKPAAAGAK